MLPPGMKGLKDNAYKNVFSWLCINHFNRQGNVTTFQAGKMWGHV